MRIQKPGNQMFGRAHLCRWMTAGILAACYLLSSPLFAPSPAAAESGSAVIVGVERLYVRRGPGAEFPPFATLTKGDTVEVQEMQGEWARIVTGSGLSGYVRSNFLQLPGEHKKPATTPPTLPTPTVKAPPVVKPTATAKTPTSTRLASPTPTTPTTLRAANAEIQRLQQQIAELKGHTDGVASAGATPAFGTPTLASALSESPAVASATPSPTPTQLVAAAAGDTDPAQAEIARLTQLVETLQRRLDARPPIEGLTTPVVPSDSPAHSWSSGLTLGIIGAALGWFVGSIWGRKPDRGRRPRVRF